MSDQYFNEEDIEDAVMDEPLYDGDNEPQLFTSNDRKMYDGLNQLFFNRGNDDEEKS